MRDCTIHVAKTKALISCAVTAQLICVFVFLSAKSRFSHNEAHMSSDMRNSAAIKMKSKAFNKQFKNCQII